MFLTPSSAKICNAYPKHHPLIGAKCGLPRSRWLGARVTAYSSCVMLEMVCLSWASFFRHGRLIVCQYCAQLNLGCVDGDYYASVLDMLLGNHKLFQPALCLVFFFLNNPPPPEFSPFPHPAPFPTWSLPPPPPPPAPPWPRRAPGSWAGAGRRTG